MGLPARSSDIDRDDQRPQMDFGPAVVLARPKPGESTHCSTVALVVTDDLLLSKDCHRLPPAAG